MKLKYCLLVIVVSSFLASLIQTNFGKVDITLERLDTDNSQYIYYDLYRPKTATSDNKAPFIAIIPGFQRSKEALSNIAIELSRRGYVVALIDPYAQGLSSSSLSTRAATTEGYGMFSLVKYVHEGAFEFIDIDKIGATGHSMGGNAAIRGADFFGKKAHHDFMDLPETVLANRKLLKETMEANGFWGIRTEWWHYNLSAGSNDKVADFTWDCPVETE